MSESTTQQDHDALVPTGAPASGESEVGKKDRPTEVVRFGRCKILRWTNQTKNGPMESFEPVKIYRHPKTGEWRETHSLSRNELLVMAEALREAFCHSAAPTGD